MKEYLIPLEERYILIDEEVTEFISSGNCNGDMVVVELSNGQITHY